MSETTPPAPEFPAPPPGPGSERGGEHAAAARRVVRNSFWLVSQPLLMNAISILATAYIARSLGRTDYGRFVFALSFIAMFMPLSNLGLRFVAVRHLATARSNPTARDEDVATYVGRMSVLRFTLAVSGVALAVAIVPLLQSSAETRHVVYLAACIIALQAITTTATDVFQAFETMRLVAQVQFVSGLLLTVLSVVALFLGLGLLGLMASYVVGNLVGAGLAVYYLYSRFTVPKLSIDLRFWKASLVSAAPLFLPNLVREAGSRLGIVMLGGLVDQAAVGTYGAASTLVERLAVIPDGASSALFPTLASLFQRSRAEAAVLYRRFFRYFLILAAPIAVGAMILSEPIVALIYGSRYEESPAVLAILGWGLFGTFFAQLQGWSVAAIHQEKRAFYVPFVATAVYLLMSALLIPRFGPVGLAAASLAMAGIHVLLYRFIIRAHLTAGSRGQRGLVLRIVAANAVMAAVVLVARRWPVYLTIPLGAATYATAVVALRAVTPEEARDFVSRVRRRLGLG